MNVQYVSLPSVEPDQTSLRVYPCDGQPCSMVVWIHGGGWTKGDRRRIHSMPTFFRENSILFASVNYPLKSCCNTSLIDLQVGALLGLNEWFLNSPIKEQYPKAFQNITILTHSSGSHLVALADKLNGWNSAVRCLILMDSGAYDLRARFQHTRQEQRNAFCHLLGLDPLCRETHESVLCSYSPALLPAKQRLEHPLKVIIITSLRPGALYSAEHLEKSYNMPGYSAVTIRFPWSHEAFPEAVGVDHRLNELILHAVGS
jgi:hypothetical protein